MRVAFYAPMKPPDHPVPSGDRRMARAFMDLLRDLGHEVELASRHRSYDRDGDAPRQRRLALLGARFAARLVRRYGTRPPARRPGLWFTYHLYHKAPDWLGPPVARALGIPYVVAEASAAARQRHGPWADGYAASRAAIAEADLVLALTRNDLEGLLPVVRPGRLAMLPPFLDTAPFVAAASRRAEARAAVAARFGLDPGCPWLLVVAMMRPDVKLASFTQLATALGPIAAAAWQLVIAGDGPASAEVEAAMAPLGRERVRMLGALPPSDLLEIYPACDLYVWPAVGEAYGVALLEAQAAGLPVVAGAEGGVPDIVADGVTGILVAPRRPDLLADAVGALLADPDRRRAMGRQALAHAVAQHDVARARDRLATALAHLPTRAEQVRCASA